MAADASADQVILSEWSQVQVVVNAARHLVEQCVSNLDEAYEHVEPFQKAGTLCVAIRRNLYNLIDTLKIIRFFSKAVDTLVSELRDSLELCLAFLMEYAPSKGGHVTRPFPPDECEEISNKLAFMNKLLHLNQHSLNIRLLMELPEHARLKAKQREESARRSSELHNKGSVSNLSRERKQELAAKIAALNPKEEENGAPMPQLLFYGNDVDPVRKARGGSGAPRPRLAHLAYGKPHRNQSVYGPIRAPVFFSPPSRAQEFAQFTAQIKGISTASPLIVCITGDQGVGKTTYARYLAQKLHAFLDYHTFVSCSVGGDAPTSMAPAKDSAGNDPTLLWRCMDSETIMRSFLAPSQIAQLEGCTELARAFRLLCWKSRGVMLLDGIQTPQQLTGLIPRRGCCAVLVTSSSPVIAKAIESHLSRSDAPDAPDASTVSLDDAKASAGGKGKNKPPPVFIHQHLAPLPANLATQVCVGAAIARGPDAGAAYDAVLSQPEGKALSEFVSGLPVAIDVVAGLLKMPVAAQRKAGGDAPVQTVNAPTIAGLIAAPSGDALALLTIAGKLKGFTPKIMTNGTLALLRALKPLPKLSQELFTKLFVFPGTFSAEAALAVFAVDMRILKDAIRPLISAALVRCSESDKRFGAAAAAAAGGDANGKGNGAHGNKLPITNTTRFWLHDTVRDFSALMGLQAGACSMISGSAPPPNMGSSLLVPGRYSTQLHVTPAMRSSFITHYSQILSHVDELLVPGHPQSAEQEAFRLFDKEQANVSVMIQEVLLAASTGQAAGIAPATIVLVLQPRLVYAARFSARRRIQLYLALLNLDGVKNTRSSIMLAAVQNLADAYTEFASFDKAIPYYKHCQKTAEALLAAGGSASFGAAAFLVGALRGLVKVSELLGERQIAVDYATRVRAVLEKQLAQPTGGGAAKMRERERLVAEFGPLLLHTATLHIQTGAFQNALDILKDLLQFLAKESAALKALAEAVGPKASNPGVTPASTPVSSFDGDRLAPENTVTQLGESAASVAQSECRALFMLGEVYTRTGDWDTASNHLKDAADRAQRLGDLGTLANSFRMLERCYENMGYFFKAHCYRERLMQLVTQAQLPLV